MRIGAGTHHPVDGTDARVGGLNRDPRPLMIVPQAQVTDGMTPLIAASFGLTRLISSFLFGVKSWDPLAFVTIPVLLMAVALLAVWLPAARAARLDPMRALGVK